MATRHERVVLTLEDNFTTSAARAAAATALINRELKSLSGAAVGTHRPLRSTSGEIDRVSTSARRGVNDLDRFSGRARLLAEAALAFAPAGVAIGAVAIPAVSGLAAQFGAAALAGGTAIAAFQGVGDALTAVNEAALEPSTENLEAARIAMENLSPAAQDLVRELDAMRPALNDLRDSAAAGFFPGLLEGLRDMQTVLPDIERMLSTIGGAAGELGADLGEAFASERGREFLAFLRTEIPPTLVTLGQAVGNIAAGLAEMWMAFAPLNRDFSSWMLDAARGFDDWAAGLAQTEGFREFIEYVRTNGPRVADAMGAIGNALLQVVQAAAPLGGPVLAALEAVSDLIAGIANSDYGPALVGIALAFSGISRAMKVFEGIKKSSLFTNLIAESNGVTGSLTRLQAAGLGAAVGITAAFVAGNKLVDAFREDLPGVEQLTGMLLDLSGGEVGALPDEFNSLADSIERINDPSFWKGQATSDMVLGFFGQEGRTLANATDEIEALDGALTNLVASAGAAEAEQAFASLARSQGLTADETSQLLGLLPQYRDALAGAANQARYLGDEAGAAGGEAAEGFERARTAAQEFRFQLEALNRVLEGRASLRDYEASIDDFSAAVKRNGRTLDITTAKGRENQAALDAIASSALSVAEGMRGTNRTAFLQRARQDMIDAAMKLGRTRGEARALADQLGLLDNMKVNPNVQVDTARAEGNVRNLLSAMAQIRSKTVTVTTVFTESGRRFKEFGAGYATGGFTGNMPAWQAAGIVHGREVVIPEWLVRRDAAMLKQRYGFLPGMNNLKGYRSGGYVDSRVYDQRVYSSGSSPSVSVGSPNVSVGGARVQVMLDGKEIRTVVREEIAAERRFQRVVSGR